MTTLKKMQFDFIMKQNKMTDFENSAKEILISDYEVTNRGLNMTYRTYNHEFECGGWESKVNFIGNFDDIVDNLNHLIFTCVELKKRNFNGIKIYVSTNNKVSKKHKYENVNFK